MNQTKPIRESNVELLRILAMLMIFFLHYLNGRYGGMLYNVKMGETNFYISYIMEDICIIGPNLFVAISAYFMVNTDKVQIRKMISLYGQMVFWNLLFYVLSTQIGENSFSLKELVRQCIPFIYGKRWFVETYLLLMTFAPFINVLIRHIGKREYRFLILAWTAVYSVWSSFFQSPPSTDEGYGLANFVTIYLIVGYMKLHMDETALMKKKKYLALVWGISAGITIILSILPVWMRGRDISDYFYNYVMENIYKHILNYDFLFNVTASVAAFWLFRSVKMKPLKAVNLISSTTFGVYLIHTDPSIRTVLYQKILHCGRYYHSVWFVLHMLVCAVAVFVCAAMLELLRKKLWKHTADRLLDRFANLDITVDGKT